MFFYSLDGVETILKESFLFAAGQFTSEFNSVNFQISNQSKRINATI
jgi:hypothetical protein